MLRILSFLLICSVSLASDLAELIKTGNFWNQSAKTSLQGIHFTQPDPEHIQASRISLGELSSGEAIITIKDKKPVSVQAMLYNKGDDGAINYDDFHGQIDAAKEALSELTGARAKLRKAGKSDAAVKMKTWEWKWENGIMRLEASSTGKKRDFEAEFIRLVMAADAKGLNAGGARDSVRKSSLRDNITTEEDGTVWLQNMPMVDQGQKGYCVPATLARVFAYYGMDKVDQHALAAACDSQGSGGTSSRDMETAMEDVCKQFRTKFIVMDDYMTNLKGAVENYNKFAKREDKDPLGIYDDVFGMADAKVLRQARAGKPSQINKWLKDIKKNIDAGTPVIWMVMLGIYQEEVSLPQSRGGHARLIIGYNLKKKTIIYTDSWGAMHARKTIPAADAAAMTTGRYIIKLR